MTDKRRGRKRLPDEQKRVMIGGRVPYPIKREALELGIQRGIKNTGHLLEEALTCLLATTSKKSENKS